ncbi:MAG: cobalt ECF transporter T component CbiQ [Dehalococcoidia bacterium]|nr:cobalt ECF transporter T component CbiQ [Dehalococcoidia bacterium]
MSFAAIAERYHPGASLLHRADARVKLPAAIAYILAVTLTPVGGWPTMALMALPVVLGLIAAHLPVMLVLRRTALALPFVLAAFPLLFTREGEELFALPLVGWDASREGLEALTTILAKSWISVTAAVILTASTPATELVRAMRSMGLPRLLVGTISFMYRYIFVIGEEAWRLLRARDARSASRDGLRSGGSIPWRGRVAGNMVGSLFLRSYERSERVYAAMQARGYDGETRFMSTPVFPVHQAIVAGLILAYAFGVQVYAHL